MSANCTFRHVCFFSLARYAVTRVAASVASPSGCWDGLNHRSSVLGSQVDFWALGDSVSSVRIRCAVFTHSAMLQWLYQKVVFIRCIHNLKSSCYKDPDCNSAEFTQPWKKKLSHRILPDYLVMAGEQFLLLLR
jgi:hypothetical protein